ncbi:hypothetical protein B0H67DRAFT_566294 [Lasiosphaeris hirsuta]|uniref:Uncharacterized protein n=1 Tax=Lasiosphaeris hirsuta TaxID=260670 RepID=A0AA40BCY4_9PEZI|nr:hypothetical protein B0H67DRAFT_566294 [Lasiosphaeris hirsuta]
MASRFLRDPVHDHSPGHVDDVDKKANPRFTLRCAPSPPRPQSPDWEYESHGPSASFADCPTPTLLLGPHRPLGVPHLLDTASISPDTNLRSFRLCDAVATFLWKYNKLLCPKFFDPAGHMVSMAIADRRTHQRGGDDRNFSVSWHIYRGDQFGSVSAPFPPPWQALRPSLAPAPNVAPEMWRKQDELDFFTAPIPIQVEYYPNGSQTRSWGYAGVQTAMGEWKATHVKGWDDKEWRTLHQDEMELYGSYIGREMLLKTLYYPTPYLEYFLMVKHQKVHNEWPSPDRGRGMRAPSLGLKTSSELVNMGAGHYQNYNMNPASFDAPSANELNAGDPPLRQVRPGTFTRELEKERHVMTFDDYMDYGP